MKGHSGLQLAGTGKKIPHWAVMGLHSIKKFNSAILADNAVDCSTEE